MGFKRVLPLLVLVLTLSGVTNFTFAQNATDNSAPAKEEKKSFNATESIFWHVADSHEWHFFSLAHPNGEASPVAMPLPIIVYQPGKGLQVFSSTHFEEWTMSADGKIAVSNSYNGFHLQRGMKEKLLADDGSQLYDLSITKNTVSMIISVVLLLWMMMAVAKQYKRRGTMAAPSGFQNFLEVIIVFMQDEVAKPNLGHKSKKFMPLILTVFFFIWINNMLGLCLLPVGINFTGNIAVTLALSVVSFVVMIAKSNKHFWGHLLNPPNVPFGIKLILVPIEIMSLFIKPVALTIRLFANMLAGHIVILSVVCMIFIFGSLNKGIGVGFVPVSLAFSIFMYLLEILVAAIQAFIFANLTAVFIGQAIEENHSEETGQQYHVNENEIIA